MWKAVAFLKKLLQLACPSRVVVLPRIFEADGQERRPKLRPKAGAFGQVVEIVGWDRQRVHADDFGPTPGRSILASQARPGRHSLSNGHIQVLEIPRPQADRVDVRPRQEERRQLDIADEEDPLQFRLGSVPTLQRGAHLLGALVVQGQDRKQRDAKSPPPGGSLQVILQGGGNQLVQAGIHDGCGMCAVANEVDCGRQRTGPCWRCEEVGSRS